MSPHQKREPESHAQTLGRDEAGPAPIVTPPVTADRAALCGHTGLGTVPRQLRITLGLLKWAGSAEKQAPLTFLKQPSPLLRENDQNIRGENTKGTLLYLRRR